MTGLNEKSLELLEFPKIRERLAQYTSFSGGRELVLALTPSPDFDAEQGGSPEGSLAGGLAHLALALTVAASGVVFWGTHRPEFTLESPHPYPDRADLAWIVVNPDDGAASTAARVARLGLAGNADRLYLLDKDWQIRAELKAGDLAEGGWTPPIPGQFVILKLVTDGQGQGWGFRVDGVATADSDAGL